MKKASKLSRFIRYAAILTALLITFSSIPFVKAEETDIVNSNFTYHDARPSTDGQLKVDGVYLVNEAGEHVTIRGVSTHGITWYPDYINGSLFNQMSEEWGADFIRLPMYTTEYLKDKEYNLEMLRKGINLALENDMYVLVDWHILDDCNPLTNADEAEKFFEMISSEYAGNPGIIYEICNEPNGSTTWDDITQYSNRIIPVIRKNSPDSVIIVGTADYDRELSAPAASPLQFENIMYSFHFYTASHYEDMYNTLNLSRNEELPVFISECGISEADGDGKIDYDNAVKWFTFLHDEKISYVVWNLSNKNESSSFIKATSGEKEHLKESDLTDSGKWVMHLIQGDEPIMIETGATEIDYSIPEYLIIQIISIGDEGLTAVRNWPVIAIVTGLLYLFIIALSCIIRTINSKKINTYDDIVMYKMSENVSGKEKLIRLLKRVTIWTTLYLSTVYLYWRLMYSINIHAGWLPIACNILLLIVEAVGFAEFCIHYVNMINLKNHPLPKIEDNEFPEVDIFIATYNEPAELLEKTVNGCKHLKYPDTSKVHIWLCDDNRRPAIRELAEKMGVGYFDRPDNKGAKAGNLNNALKQTSAPYVVTLDADMIVRSEFLLKTIPYFVYVEKVSGELPEGKKKHLGLLQSPQCFYDPDVFQYSLYSENNIPNEQDFFYRTIEVGKTSSNSVIYGGSNTVISRQALEDIGGFYTESITEDFATGMLIESKGYLSLGIAEPLASGQTPHTFKEHIKQRTRWGRGVINTAKKLKIFSRRDLTLAQKLSYWSSYTYWYSPIKNLVYILSPLFFAVFMIPVFKCSWLDLVIFWLPMFILQDVCLKLIGGKKMSLKWSGIYETSVMPFLLIPVIKETFGMSLTKFQVTDKSGKNVKKEKNTRYMIPFIILLILSVTGIVRILFVIDINNSFGMIVILFWLIKNLYSIILVMFMISGRDSDADDDTVKVKAGEMTDITIGEKSLSGITSTLTEHNINVFIDDPGLLSVGDKVNVNISTEDYSVNAVGIIINTKQLRKSDHEIVSIELLDFGTYENRLEYLQILYDRIPTLPQTLQKDFGLFGLFWRNVVYRMIRTI